MSRLIETIQIRNGKPLRLALHEARLNHSRKVLYGAKDFIRLSEYINPPTRFKKGIVKCKLLVNDKIQEIRFSHYHTRRIKSLKLVVDNTIEYTHKIENRQSINALLAKPKTTEILIIKNGLITDASIYNVAFKKNGVWFTPKEPLLGGIMRESLIKESKIIPMDIHVSDIPTYSQICLFNALNEWETLVFPCSIIENLKEIRLSL